MSLTLSSVLLSLLDEAFDRKAWHGTTLLGSIRGLDAAAAARRPAPGRHNIWEIVVHAAYWKYAVARRIVGVAFHDIYHAGQIQLLKRLRG